ncbi:unnamed protein product [Closterium sp. NIES-64]|nr:unnamed protein product [Closterium sp. NIES-64]
MASRVILSQARAAGAKHAPLSDNLIAHLLRPLKNPPAAPSPAATSAASAASKFASAADPPSYSSPQAPTQHPPALPATDLDRPYRSQFSRRPASSAISPAVVPLLLNLQPSPQPTFVGSILDTCVARPAEDAVPVVSWANVLPASDGAVAPGEQLPAEATDSAPLVLPLPVLSAAAASPSAGPSRRRPVSVADSPAATKAGSVAAAAPRGVQVIVDDILSGRFKDSHRESWRAANATNASATAPRPAVEPAAAPPAATVAAVTAALRAPPSPKPNPAPSPTAKSASAAAEAADFPALPSGVTLPDVFPLMPSPIASPKAAPYLSALTDCAHPPSATSSAPAVAGFTSASKQVAFTIGSPLDEFFSPDASPPAQLSAVSYALDQGDSLPMLSATSASAAAGAAAVYHHPHFLESQDNSKSPSARRSSKGGKQAKAGEAKPAARSADRNGGKRSKAGGSAEADDWVRQKLEQPQASVGHGRGLDAKKAGGKTATTVAIGAPGGVVRTLELYLPYSTPATNPGTNGPAIGAVAPAGPRVPDGTRGRVLFVNDSEGNDEFGFSSNRIYTTKYTWYTFLPRGLFEQFRRVANLYFLFHACVSLTPLSSISPMATVPPLVFVVGLAMAKELWEDIKRGSSDYETNKRKATVIRPDGTEATRRWRDLRVGELIRVPHDAFLPADIICVATSGDGGACYVETMNLDGETNLKMRSAVFETHAMSAAELPRVRGRVECEHPNASIYTFAGKMLLRTSTEGAISGRSDSSADIESSEGSQSGDAAPIFITPANILLRGSRLRNTKWAVGIVVYTGRETKIMMNSTDPPSKRSFVEKRLDFVIMFELVVLVGLATFSSVMYGVYLGKYMPQQWYLRPEDYTGVTGVAKAMYNWQQPALAGFMQFFTALVLYGYFVPISLYVTMELVKLVQAATIALDLHMYYEEKDIPTTARTSNLNEELGMVHTVLSDKTGTLTRNQMDFFKCSIAGIAYGTGVTEVEKAAAQRMGQPIPDEDEETEGEEGVYTPLKPLEKGYNMKDPRLDDLKWRTQPTAAEIRRFLEVMSVCHTVIADTGDAADAAGGVGKAGGAGGGGAGGGVGEGWEAGAAGHVGDGESSSDDDDEYEAAMWRDDGGMVSVGGSMRSLGGSLRSLGGSMSSYHTADARSAQDSFHSLGSSEGARQGATRAEQGSDHDMTGGGAGEVSGVGSVSADPDAVRYLAESPDEAAFVVAGKRMGMVFAGRQGREVRVQEFAEGWVLKDERRYTLLHTIEFTSHRKRMSVIVRTPEGNLVLLCKGADNIIMDRLGSSEEAQRHRPITEKHMRTYAEAGLRTLAISWKEIGEEEYASWQARWESAKANMADVAVQAAELEGLADEMERGLILLGATAIEDKLQVRAWGAWVGGVRVKCLGCQAIEAMAAAGIRLWVLTGDKLETAVNIGFACRLLRPGMQQHVAFLEDNDKLAADAAAAGADPAELLRPGMQQHVAFPAAAGADPAEFAASAIRGQILSAKSAATAPGASHAAPHALIIDGKALTHVLADAALRSDFLRAALACASVICCRVSPKQKAQVTELVGSEGGMITLGIGDGANDVGMIQKAHIGVGIAGEEGQQAVMAADFAIGQFRFVERLLLVHGAWSYTRITYMIKYFLYKCHTFAFTIFFFNGLALFSGSAVYVDWLLVLFQVLFSSLPVAAVGAFDQDVKAIYHLRYPRLYAQSQRNWLFTLGEISMAMGKGMSQRNRLFTVGAIGMAMGKGMVQAAILFAVSFLPLLLSSSGADGRVLDLTAQGSILFTALVLAVNLELAITIQYWTVIHHMAVWGSIALWFIFLAIVSYVPATLSASFYGMAPMLLPRPAYYLIVLLATVATLLPGFAAASITRYLAPTDVELVQEVQQQDHKRRLTRLATMRSTSITRYLALTDVELVQEVQQLDHKRRLTRLVTMRSSRRR